MSTIAPVRFLTVISLFIDWHRFSGGRNEKIGCLVTASSQFSNGYTADDVHVFNGFYSEGWVGDTRWKQHWIVYSDSSPSLAHEELIYAVQPEYSTGNSKDLYISVVVLGLGPLPWDVLEDKFWVLGLGLEQKSFALANQVLGLARLVIFCETNTATMLKSTFIAWMTLL